MSEDTQTQAVEEQSLSGAVAELRAIEERKALLEQEIAQRKKDFLMEVVGVVKAYITENGYEIAEIASHLVPTKRAKPAKRKASTGGARPVMALNSDPSKQYSRGVMPSWMKEAMVAANLDPTDASARGTFRADFMHVVGGAPAAVETPVSEAA